MSGEGGGWITWVHSKEGGDTGVQEYLLLGYQEYPVK